MEIEFRDDAHEAANRKIHLQLKSGDSYLRERKSDGAEIFTIKKEHHARYWMASRFPVLLVIRNAEGEVRWMEVRDWLKRESENGKKPVKQIVFEGERIDVMSVRRWRDRILGQDWIHRLPVGTPGHYTKVGRQRAFANAVWAHGGMAGRRRAS